MVRKVNNKEPAREYVYTIYYSYEDRYGDTHDYYEEIFEGTRSELEAHIKEMKEDGCFNINVAPASYNDLYDDMYDLVDEFSTDED